MLNAYYYGILVTIGINIILALGLNVVTGFTGQLHLGHAAFMAVGAYTAGILTVKAGLPFWFALLAGGVTAALFGVVVGLPTLRLRGDYLAIATLGFGEILRVAFINSEITGGPFGLRGIAAETDLLVVGIWVVIAYVVFHSLIHSRAGRALIAIREDEVAAEAMGINATYYKVWAFVIAAFFAGVAGGLFAHWFRYLNPNTFGFVRSIELLSMVVLGGLGSLPGAVLGATVMTYAPEFLRSFFPAISEHRMTFYGALLVLMMLVRPQGLLGAGETLPWLKDWRKRRRRLAVIRAASRQTGPAEARGDVHGAS